MALDTNRYQLTHLLQDAWYRLGQLKKWNATSGSQTTAVNALWAGVEEQTFEDDDPALIYGTVVVIRDAGGLHAAPEGEMSMITDYDSASQTATIDSLSAGISVGDKIGIASPLFPLEDMVELANLAIQKLGEIDTPEYINVQANTISYSLPSTVRSRPVLIRYISPITTIPPRVLSGWSVMPDFPSTNLVLSVPRGIVENGGRYEVFWRTPHPKLTAFDSNISEFINPELALCALVAEAYQWYNNQLGGSNQYMLQRENKALQDLEAALVKYPIQRIAGHVNGFPHWRNSGEYIPLTGDLKA
jgi:hypothetical protein